MGAIDKYVINREVRSPGFADMVETELAAIRSFDAFVNAVREVVSREGIRQKDLAEAIGMDPSNLSRLLNSEDGNPELSTITRIASALDYELVLRPRTAVA